MAAAAPRSGPRRGRVGRAASLCDAEWGEERGAARHESGCGVAALGKADEEPRIGEGSRSSSAIFFFLFFEKRTDERHWIRRSAEA